MKNRSILGGLIVGLFCCVEMGGAEDKSEKKPPEAAHPSIWMKKKLDYSQAILGGIVTGDFDKIVENARAMKGLGKIEAFVRNGTPGYGVQLHIFNEANDELIRQAEKDNVEGAALAFTSLTISCVNCHKQLREHQRVEKADQAK